MKKKKLQLHSLGAKNALTLISISAIIGLCSVLFSLMEYKYDLKQQLAVRGENVGNTLAAQLEPASIERYLDTGIKDPDYFLTLTDMRKIVDNNRVKYAVVIKLTDGGFNVVFDSDRGTTAYDLGDYVSFEEWHIQDHEQDMLDGKTFYLFDDWTDKEELISVLVPIIDKNDVVRSYVVVDIATQEITDYANAYLFKIIAILVAITGIIVVVSIVVSDAMFIRPVNTLAKATYNFANSKNLEESSSDRTVIDIPQLETGDEIEGLYRSIKKMETDIYDYIDNLKAASAEKERIGAELNIASQIQLSMLPNEFPAFPNRNEFDLFASMTPAREVGGDFYDYFFIDDDHLVLCIADVSGKGVAAALFMAITKVILQNSIATIRDPAKMFESVNDMLSSNNKAEMFVTVWVGVLEISTGKLTCANAGHEYPYIIHSNGNVELIKDKHGLVIGGMCGVKYHPYEIQLEHGDKIFVYTDGVTEATNSNEKLFTQERVTMSLDKHSKCKPLSLAEGLMKDINKFVGDAPQFDDVTMLVLEYL